MCNGIANWQGYGRFCVSCAGGPGGCGVVRLLRRLCLLVCFMGLNGSVMAAVDFELRAVAPAAAKGAMLDIELYAQSDSGMNEPLSAVDAVIVWEGSKLELTGATPNPSHSWLIAGLLDDSGADGLNDSLADGDAFFQAVTLSPIPTVDPYLITTLHFAALERTEGAWVALEYERGTFSGTRAFRFGGINEDIVGALQGACVAIAETARLWIPDVHVRPGQIADVMVFGELAGEETYSVTVLLVVESQDVEAGSVTFTPAPPEDIEPMDQPWPEGGSFDAFDTDTAGSVTWNGSIHDNGLFVVEPTDFLGPLALFPVIASEDAWGVWRIRFLEEQHPSSWEAVQTELVEGLVRMVGPGDGDASGSANMLDFSYFQGCFTGPVGPTDVPAYDRDPRRYCGVYDEDGDGDIDAEDFAAFAGVMAEPAL
jgi:hypothetical protein